MNKLKTLFVGSLICVAITPVFAAKKTLLNIQHWQTQNGAKVFFVKASELPMLDVAVVFAAGSAYDHEKYGLSALTNSLIGQGTKTLDANQIAAKFNDVGAQFSTNSGRVMGTVQLRTLTRSAYLDPALKTFADVLSHPAFRNKAIKRVKNQTIADISYGEEQAGTIAGKTFSQIVYRNTPYAHSPIGSKESVKQISVGQLQRFYKKYYVAKNADVVLVGDVSTHQAHKIAAQLVSGLPAGEVAASLKSVHNLASGVKKHVKFPSRQTSIVVGQVGISRKNPDYFPLIVGNYIFGGAALTSILFKQLREQRGLTYSVYSGFSPAPYRGTFTIRLKTRSDQTAKALRVLHHSLKEFIEQGPTVQQLQAAKESLIGRFPLSFAKNSSILSMVVNIAFYHRPLNFLDSYQSKISEVTSGQVMKAFRQNIHLDRMAVVTVGK